MWQAVQAVLVIFLMIGVGIFVSWRKWVSQDVAKVFPLIIVNIAMPSTVIHSLSENFTRQELFDSWLPLSIVFILMPLSFLIGTAAAAIFKIPKTRRGIFTTLFSFSNSVFIGFPVVRALFDEPGMPFAVFYYLANTTFFWILGYYSIRKDADAINGVESSVSALEVAKKLATPPFITIIIMFIFILSGIVLPDFILDTAGYLSGLTSPLSLIFMGCMVYSIGFAGLKYEKGIGPIMAGRYLVIPALCFAACTIAISLMPSEGSAFDLSLMRSVFTVQIGLPVMTQTVIVSEMYGADTKYATKNVLWTTLASLITIPAYMLVFQFIK